MHNIVKLLIIITLGVHFRITETYYIEKSCVNIETRTNNSQEIKRGRNLDSEKKIDKNILI